MRYGIPRYRLPREVLDAEITRLLDLGITLEVDTPVTDLDAVMADEGWDAAFLAVGAQLGHRTYLPAASAARVLDAVSLLHGLEDGERPLLGRRVAVYGGGNTAVDAARTARRLGASDAVVVYRRTRERMPAHAEEVADAEEEGVVFHWLSTIERVEPDGLVVEQMELDDGRLPPAHRAGPRGWRPTAWSWRSARTPTSPSWARPPPSRSPAARSTRTPRSPRPGPASSPAATWSRANAPSRSPSVTVAARPRASTTGWPGVRPHLPLRSTWRRTRPSTPGTSRTPTAPTASASTWPGAAPRSTRWCTASTATRRSIEARRCLSCGSCFSCDNCYAMCPDDAVIKLGPPGEYVIDLDYCKGCGLCVQECPSGAIVMVPEET